MLEIMKKHTSEYRYKQNFLEKMCKKNSEIFNYCKINIENFQ